MLQCPVCGKPDIKNGTGLSAHMRIKHPDSEVKAAEVIADLARDAEEYFAPPVYEVPVEKPAWNSPGAAILPEWRRTGNLARGHGQREIKMLAPQCPICENEENRPYDWWRTCTHDPYVTLVESHELVPTMEDELVNGRPTGRKIVTGRQDIVTYKPTPNKRGVALTMILNSGQGVVKARRKGRILPSELRSPYFPDGIADACEYRECFAQVGLKTYGTPDEPIGTFCREEEARRVALRVDSVIEQVDIGEDFQRRKIREWLAGARV